MENETVSVGEGLDPPAALKQMGRNDEPEILDFWVEFYC